MMFLKNKFCIELIKFLILIFFIGLVRIVPHSPNFTAVIAIIFYFSILYSKFSFLHIMASYILIDIYIGLHDTIYFIWLSVLIINLLADKFSKDFIRRMFGLVISCLLFFLISNLGSWFSFSHSFNHHLLEIYYLGLPFFLNSLISSIILSFIVEVFIFFLKKRIQILLQKKISL